MTRWILHSLIILALLPGCVSAAPEERKAYVLAHPHAWVEITVADPSVPDVPPPKGSDERWSRPRGCSIDGVSLLPRAPRANGVVSLEDIYAAITGRRSPSE